VLWLNLEQSSISPSQGNFAKFCLHNYNIFEYFSQYSTRIFFLFSFESTQINFTASVFQVSCQAAPASSKKATRRRRFATYPLPRQLFL
jgi:hypothetical protein